ncbi:hypothetical protein WME95_11985 [Sorangium sp. So ce327]|jgi:hypothetical protein|uniref:hypothetical protein n=1 Tax=Sorangium sp. So ce327 TaxID=3133301 RepID=UPI003F6173FF
MARYPRRIATLCAAAAMAVTSFAGTASAQIADAVYEDVRDIIEDLIQREVAEAVVPNLVCQTARRASTEQQLNDYVGIVDQLGDAADGPAKEALEKKRGELRLSIKSGFPILTYFPLTLQRVFRRQFNAIRTSVTDEAAGFAGHMVYVGLTSSEGQIRKPQGTQSIELLHKFASADDARAERAAPSKLTWTRLDPRSLNTCVSVLKEHLASGVTDAGAPSPLEKDCGASAASGTSYACELAFAVRAILQRKDALAEEHFIRAAAVVVGATAAKALEVTDDAVRRTLLDEAVLVTRDVLRGGKKLDEIIPVLLSAAPAAPAAPGTAGADAAARARELRSRLSNLERLRVQWNIGTRGGANNLDLVSFVNVIGAAGGALRDLCDKDLIGQICAQIERQSSALTKIGDLQADLWPAIRLASQGEYGEAASRAIRTFFSSRPGGEGDQVEIYRRFAEAVIVYVLATVNDKNPSDADRAAFREASVEVLRELGTGGGMDRPWGHAFYRPDMALRVSWSPSYVDGEGGSPRIVPSANTINLRGVVRYTDAYYFAIQPSFIDLLAPLSELALRRSEAVEYEDSGRVLLNAVTPRIEVMVGVPALSKHLVVSGGASLRLSAPFKKKDQEGCDGTCYRYKFLWNKKDDVLSDPAGLGFIEFGFGVKYLL